MKKVGMMLLVLLMVLGLLIGCAHSTPEVTPAVSSVPGQEATRSFLHIWSEHGETMENIVRAIEQQNEGMHVEITTVGWEELDRTVTTALNSGQMYDVFFQFGSDIGSMQQRGIVMDLETCVDETWEANFIDGALDCWRIDGTLYGLPYRGSGVVVIYNGDLFKENGWQVPETLDEMVTLMDSALELGLIPMSAPGRPDGFQLDSLRAILTDYIAQDAGLLNDELRLTGRKIDWHGELAMGARTVKDWAEKKYFGANPLSVDENTAITRFLSGNAAMLLCNTNDIHELREETRYAAFDMGSFLVPGYTAGGEKIFSNASFEDGFAVWADTAQPEQALALLKGLTSEEYGSLWAHDTLSVMALKDISVEDPLLDEFGSYFDIAGKYAVKPDYNVGDSDQLKNQLFVDYMTSTMTADEYETNYENIVMDALRGAK